MEYKIGDFSLLARLSVKTLRYYHDIGLLVPTRTDPETGYRWYNESSLARASVIRTLKDLEFSLEEIQAALAGAQDDGDLGPLFKEKLKTLEIRMARDREIRNQLSSLINSEKGDSAMAHESEEARWADLPALRFAGIRFRGRYDQVGPYYATLYRLYGRWVAGAPFALYYDGEFKETDADIEVCVPLKTQAAAVAKEGARIGELPAVPGVEVVHLGAYNELGRSYKKLLDLAASGGKPFGLPTRETYLKGPGMIFPRSPKKFITLVQVPVSD